jgi:hypothetical protein
MKMSDSYIRPKLIPSFRNFHQHHHHHHQQYRIKENKNEWTHPLPIEFLTFKKTESVAQQKLWWVVCTTRWKREEDKDEDPGSITQHSHSSFLVLVCRQQRGDNE